VAVGLLQNPARSVIDQVRIHVRAVQLTDAAAEHPHGGGDVGQQQLAHAVHVIMRDVEHRRRRCAAAAGETRHEAATVSHGPLAGKWRQELMVAVGVVTVVCAVVVLVCAAPACLRSSAHVPW
jgi:hypothetical protein